MSDNEESVITVGEHSGITINNEKKVKKRSIGEEEWSKYTVELLSKWRDQAHEASCAHAKTGLKKKGLHVRTALPSILIPLCFAPISSSSLSDEDGFKYANMAAFIVSGSLSAINNFFNYSALHEKHMNFSAKYGDVVTTVDYELAKQEKYRRPPDEMLTYVQVRLDSLNAQAPDL